MGLVSPLGNNKAETLESLRETRSGIKFQEEYKEMGLRSHIAGSIDLDVEPLIERSLRICQLALNEAKLQAGNMDDVLLVGGQTRMPYVQKRVTEFFGRKPRTDPGADRRSDHPAPSFVRIGASARPDHHGAARARAPPRSR